MKTYIFFCALILFKIITSNEVNNDFENVTIVNENVEDIEKPDNLSEELPERDFEKDIEDLDLSGYEDDIEDIEELAKKPSYVYVTQMYVYIRIDGEYEKYKENSELLDLGTRYMTVLQNAFLSVQLKITGLGEYTCYFRSKDMISRLTSYFLAQPEVDFIDADTKTLYPENRNVPITSKDERRANEKFTPHEDL